MDGFSMDSSEKKDDDVFLPEHTKAMRKALAYCQQLIEGHTSSAKDEVLSSSSPPTIYLDVDQQAQLAARTISEQRHMALTHFWERQQELFDSKKHGSGDVDENGRDEASMFIEIISLCPESPLPPLSAVEFRKRFQNANQPCLIRGLDQTPYFSSICSKWRVTSMTGEEDTSGVNRDWFINNIGKDTKVPVRFQPCSASLEGQSLLDNDGRAVECATKEMCLHEWIHLLDAAILENPTTTATKACHHYLKDWHLQSFLRCKETKERPEEDDGDAPASLYVVPLHFQHDLLNEFLTKFTDTGDYMFVYWGPRGSKTSMHSDVLNSYSWSFNVAGSKKWVFYPPEVSGSDKSDLNQYTNTAGDDDSCRGLVVTQNAGECIFVPCGWRHEVTNITRETLSINHNWVTTSNIDKAWECLCLEMKAIEKELKAWNMNDDCWDARESMLRGCVGLDVTAFFLMVLTHFLDLLLRSKGNSNGTMGGLAVRDAEESIWQWHFDALRLKEALYVMLSMPELETRLAAVLCSTKSAIAAMKLAELALAELWSQHY